MADDNAQKLTALALSFPSLRDAAGVTPWDAEALDAWACGQSATTGGLHAARFVLGVYNCRAEWRCGLFNGVLAPLQWDDEHIAAYQHWLRSPWTA